MKRWSSAKFIIGAGGDWWPLPEEVEAISAIGGVDDVLKKKRRFTESTDEEGQKRVRRRRRRKKIRDLFFSRVTEPTRGTVKKNTKNQSFPILTKVM